MNDHIARASMLIRRPADEVFNAFANPEMITKFWLESTTGPLEEGARVTWRFMVPGATETVAVTAFDQPRRIAFDWSDGASVDMVFEARGHAEVSVLVEVAGLRNEGEMLNATEGFSLVLCDLKTLLESGRSAHLVRDKAALMVSS